MRLCFNYSLDQNQNTGAENPKYLNVFEQVFIGNLNFPSVQIKPVIGKDSCTNSVLIGESWTVLRD